jgi:hypothetical protein
MDISTSPPRRAWEGLLCRISKLDLNKLDTYITQVSGRSNQIY